jgi:hypothetical protein
MIMSDNYSNKLSRLQQHYNLEELNAIELAQFDAQLAATREKLKKAVHKASEKGGFANTKVAARLKENIMFDLVETIGAEMVIAVIKETGSRTSEHQQILRHFAHCWSKLLDYQDEPTPEDPTIMLHANEWAYIAFSRMLDAAAIPKGNDFRIKKGRDERRRFEEEDEVPQRPSVQTVQQNIAQMVLFQTRMQFYKVLFPYWFRTRHTDALKGGSAGLRYYQRDMSKTMDDMRASLMLKEEQTEDDLQRLKILTALDALPEMENNRHFTTVLGSWLYSIVFIRTGLFEENQADMTEPKKLSLVKDAEELRKAWGKELYRKPMQHPMLAPPVEITNESYGGRLWSEAKHVPEGTVGKAVDSHKGSFEFSQTRLDFFNTQSLVPFAVNPFTLELLKTLKDQNIKLGGFDCFVSDELPRPSDMLCGKPQDYDRWDEADQYQWCTKHPDWKKVKRDISKRRTEQIERLRKCQPSKVIYELACQYAGKTIWFPNRPEFRGRLLSDAIYFHPQGRESAKALIWLDQPVEVTDDNKRDTRVWLANHIASCYGDGLDKKSFSKRTNWIADPITKEKITAVALMHTHDFSLGLQVLKEVESKDGKPLMFAAACREWYELFVSDAPKSHTQLLVGNDATCSGQQFAAAWRRSRALATAVNLIPADSPNDLYGMVYANLHDRIKGSLSERHERDLRLRGLGRSIAKGAIQPMQYGAGKDTGTAGLVAKIEKLRDKGILRLSEQEVDAIKRNFHKALAEAAEMNVTNEWFRHFAELCADSREDIIIPTALGDQVVMKYDQGSAYRIDTFKYGSVRYGRKTDRNQVTLVEPNGVPDTDRWRTALSANVTHTGDATLLAIALHDVEYGFSSNHDAVYCAAPHMNDIRDRLRKAFVVVGSFDMFSELQTANGVTVEPGSIDDPIVGDWTTIEDVLQSAYFVN